MEIEHAKIYTVKYGNGHSQGMSIYNPIAKRDYDSRYENSNQSKNTR